MRVDVIAKRWVFFLFLIASLDDGFEFDDGLL